MAKLNLQVMLKNGITDEVNRYPVSRCTGYSEGYTLEYKKDGKIQYCNVLTGYKCHVFNGVPTVGQVEGSIEAVEMFGDRNPDAPGENFALLARTHAFTDAYKTLKGGISIPWLWVAIGVIVIVVVIVGFRMFSAATAPATVPAATPAQTGGVSPIGGK